MAAGEIILGKSGPGVWRPRTEQSACRRTEFSRGAYMATRVDVPQLGLTMETGTILQWVKAEGETVEKGQPVVVIQTDKVEYEVEAPVAVIFPSLITRSRNILIGSRFFHSSTSSLVR